MPTTVYGSPSTVRGRPTSPASPPQVRGQPSGQGEDEQRARGLVLPHPAQGEADVGQKVGQGAPPLYRLTWLDAAEFSSFQPSTPIRKSDPKCWVARGRGRAGVH